MAPGNQDGTLPGMASPEIQRKIGQLRHDVDDVYEIVDGMNELVTKIAGTQQRHSTRLEEIQQALDLSVGRMDRIENTQRRQEDAQRRLEDAQRRLEDGQQRLEDGQQRLEDTQQQQYETLNAKLDSIVTLLHGNRPSE